METSVVKTEERMLSTKQMVLLFVVLALAVAAGITLANQVNQ